MKILACDGIAKEAIDLLKKEGFDVEESKKLSEEELSIKLDKGFDGLIVRSGTNVTRKSIQKSKLKVIGRAGIGVDNIDVDAATEKGIVVMNTPGGSAITTAEHTIALIFSSARQIPQADRSIRAGKWEKSKFIGLELYGKTIGIIGLGNIGYEVAVRAKAMGMNVIFCDPYIKTDRGFTKVTLDELLRKSDIITVHIPLTNETKKMISDEEFEKMKDGVIIVNCARGGIVDESSLVKYIKSGKVSSAALDVFENEPLNQESPLLSLDKIVLTPHLGASTVEAQINVGVMIAEKVAKFLKNGMITDAVNFPSIKPELIPFLNLAEKLGSFLTQAFHGVIDEITVLTNREEINPIRKSAVFGILKNILGEGVNMLNSDEIAQSRGIKLVLGKEFSKDYDSIITVSVKMNGKIHSISGTVLEGELPRIISISNLRLEAPPEGTIIFLENEDKPGVLGNIGTLLGKMNINIASIHLGRDKPGGRAIALIQVDEKTLSPETVKELKKLPCVINATTIKL